ncbi:MAG TPA: class I SAM-dependent methyltransferase, partial [Dissulfurispiraceae bacterium]
MRSAEEDNFPAMKQFLKRIYSLFPEPGYTRPRNLKLFEWMNRNAPGKRVLNLGSGVGTFDHHLSGDISMINLDISPSKPGLDIIADAHHLPFRNGSFDIVYSIAVLEHVRKPWLVAEEIERVLRQGGCVVLELPFLNTIHDEHDYFRFTDRGIRSLFDEGRFEVILDQVGSGGGSFLSVFF